MDIECIYRRNNDQNLQSMPLDSLYLRIVDFKQTNPAFRLAVEFKEYLVEISNDGDVWVQYGWMSEAELYNKYHIHKCINFEKTEEPSLPPKKTIEDID